MLNNTNLWEPVPEGFTDAGAIIFWLLVQAILLYGGYQMFKPTKRDDD